MGNFKWILLAMLLANVSLFAKSTKEVEDSENLRNGVAALYEGDNYTAHDYFLKELDSNPKSNRAYYWLAYLYKYDYKTSLSNYNKSIEYGKKDKMNLYSSYLGRSDLFWEYGDTTKAMEDLNVAEKLSDKPIGAYTRKADILFYQNKRDESETYYKKALNLDPECLQALMGMGRSCLRRDEYKKALEYFDKTSQIYPRYSDAYAFKAKTYASMKEYYSATENLIYALQYEPYNRKALYEMDKLNDEAVELLKPKLKIEILRNTEDPSWNYYLGRVFEIEQDYKSAIACYQEGLKIKFLPFLANRLSACYENLGHTKNALKYTELALSMDSADLDAKKDQIVLLLEMGDYNQAIIKADEYIKEYAYYSFGYRKKATALQRLNRYQESIDEFSMALVNAPSSPCYYFSRGIVYRAMGNEKMFKSDMQKAISCDSSKSSYYAALAYASLGDRENALAVMTIYRLSCLNENDTIIRDNGMMSYRLAVLFSLLDSQDVAIECLRNAFTSGFRYFEEVENALEFSNIRENEKFKTLLRKYKELNKKEIQELNAKENPEDSVRIKTIY